MRPGPSLAVLACAALGLALPRPAEATDCTGPLSPCVNDDTLWPHGGPARFEAVGSSDTVAPGMLGFALVSTYLFRPVVLHLASPGGPGRDADAVDQQGNGTFLWSYGAARGLQLDLALPLTFGQSGTGLAPVTGGGGLATTAVRDLRFGFAYVLTRYASLGTWRSEPNADDTASPGRPAGRGGVFGLVGRLEVSAPTGDRDQLAGERNAVFAPSLAGDLRLRRLFAGAEVGLRLRPTTQLADARIGSQVLLSAGVGADVLPRGLLAVALEAWALPTFVAQGQPPGSNGQSAPTLVPAEWQLSVRSEPLRDKDLAVQLGGGGALSSSTTTARVRFVLSLRWAPHDRGAGERRSHAP